MGNYALKMRTGNQILFNSFTSFVALAGASVANSVVMRSNELQKGITLYDEIDHKPVGQSKRAAYSAVM